MFKARVGEEEVIRLKRSNLRKVKRRSGMDPKDLELMLETGELLGKTYKIKYKVVKR